MLDDLEFALLLVLQQGSAIIVLMIARLPLVTIWETGNHLMVFSLLSMATMFLTSYIEKKKLIFFFDNKVGLRAI